MKKPMTRRHLLKTASAAAVAAPMIVPSSIFGQNAPSNTIRVAGIGMGRMGGGDIMDCLHQGLDRNVRIVAVCDVDSKRAGLRRDRIKAVYLEKLGKEAEVKAYEDFQEVLDRDDIDAVTISTPDHSHAMIALAAAAAKKDIHIQKPLTYSVREGQKLVKAVRANGVVLQVGSQQRSSIHFRKACELVRNGALGKLNTVEVVIPSDRGYGDPATSPVPANLNYDRWVGPAPMVPYAEAGVHPQGGFGRPGWLQIEAYCRGMITGWGSHMYDIAQWALGCDKDSGPLDVIAASEFPERGLFNVHLGYIAEANYPDKVKMISHHGAPGVKFIGEKGWIWVARGRLQAAPMDLLRTELGEEAVRLPVSNQHMANFLECIRTREDPIAPVEAGHRSNSVCVIHHIAMKLGRRLHWDPAAEKFVKKEYVQGALTATGDDEEANALLDFEHRAPYTV